mgnify:CR=1 FL=1
MVAFPSEVGYERSQDGTDLIRPGCSIGFNRLLGAMKTWAYMDKHPRWSMVLINGATVFRNNFDPSKSYDQIKQLFLSDLDQFVLYLEAYLSIVAPRGYRIPVVVYIPDYGKLPKEICREASNRDLIMSKLFSQMLQESYRLGPRLFGHGAYTDRWVIPVGKTMTPQREITSWIHQSLTQGQLGSYRWRDKVCLISHCAVDLHIYRKVPEIELFESHTALIKTPGEFGSKLISEKKARIPFSVFTHRVFGDAVHIKPLITGRKRTQLIELANTHKWIQHSELTMFKDVESIEKIPPREFHSFSF